MRELSLIGVKKLVKGRCKDLMKAVAHVLNCKHQAESELEVGQGFKLSKPSPSDVLPETRLHLPIISPNSATNEGPSVQVLEPVRDISYPNHHSLKGGFLKWYIIS